MAFTWGDIRSIVTQRRSEESETKRRMVDVLERYNGDYVIPMPSVEGQPEMEPPVPRLIADGIEHIAMFASSVRPVISSPPLDGNKEKGVRSREYASIRERAMYASWHRSQMDLQIRKGYRQLAAYGSTCFIVVPDFKNGYSKIELRDALTAYPELRVGEDIRRPDNVAFVFGRSSHWLRANYPAESRNILGIRDLQGERIWDLVEWVDEDDIVIGVIGPRSVASHMAHRNNEGEFSVELRRWKNRAGVVPVGCGNRITLDRVMGQMDTVLATNDLLGKMMGLDVLAVEKGIFPDRFVVGADGRPPQLISGEWKDGRSGQTNLLANVSNLGELSSSPGPMTASTIDRLESAVRQTGGVNPLASGLTSSSLRTGRSIDNFQAVNIEPRVVEAQQIMERILTYVNEGIVAVEKGYFPSKKIFAFSGWPTSKGIVEYVPKEHFETHWNTVNYQFPGTDAAGATVTIGQMRGSGMMSQLTGLIRHPWVEDPAGEKAEILSDQLENAVLAGVQQQASQGTLPIQDVARIKQLVSEGMSIDSAVLKTNQEAQARQATQAPAAEEGQISAPEAQPGLAQPGQGAEQPLPEVQGPTEGQQNLRNLLVAMRRT